MSLPSAEVRAVFAQYSDRQQKLLSRLRVLIYTTAKADPRIGSVVETLKWGQPAYLTESPKSGTTVRIDAVGATDCAVYVSCQTTLIESLRVVFPNERYQKNRALWLDVNDSTSAAAALIEMALTYHLSRKFVSQRFA